MNEEERKVNLESIMYDTNGNFVPLTASHGNINSELSLLRNTYMEAERDYFEHLLTNDVIRNKFEKLLQYDSPNYINFALQLQENLENGTLETREELEMMRTMTPSERDNFHMKKLEEAEALMCLLLAAVRDKVKILELVKTYSGGRIR